MPTTVTDPIKRAIETVAALAADAFRDHRIYPSEEFGLRREWLCKRDKSGFYWFMVLSGPGWLMIRGDLGTIVWERAEDMIAWAKRAIEDLDYMAGKVTAGRTRVYDPEVARKWFVDEIAAAEADGNAVRVEQLRDILEDPDDPIEMGDDVIKLAIHNAGLCGCDMPDFRNWDNQYLWQHQSLKWFLEHAQL